MTSTRLSRWLAETNRMTFSTYCIVASFGAYFCMYAFRRPFTVGTFEGLKLLGIDYKIVLILSQVAGYTLSKFIGIRFVSEVKPQYRVLCILSFIGFAEFSLLLFGLVPFPYNFGCLFLNGLPLGMIWGFIFSFLEGRSVTEVLGAGLSASFIVSSGVVKAVGKFTMDAWGISEFWMPFVTGLLFLGPLCLFVWMLSQIPPPSRDDVALRTERVPMTRSDRIACFKQFASGLGLLIFTHMLLTAYRDFRDNFQIEILDAIGYGDAASNLATSESIVAVLVLVALGATMAIKTNALAFSVLHGIMFAGVTLSGLSTVAYRAGWINPYLWFTLIGLGLYLAYVPFHSILFERLIAAFRYKSNAGFLIYLVDATGYLASVFVLLYKNFGAAEISWLDFFVTSTYLLTIIGAPAVALSWVYFIYKTKSLTTEFPETVNSEDLAPDTVES